jgi:hypothetical protein
MLGFRLVWTGTMWLINLPVVLLLWRSMHPVDGAGAGQTSAEDF